MVNKIKTFEYFSLAVDESGDINDTAQLMGFICGVDKNLEVSEYLLNLTPLTENTIGEEIFTAVCDTVES